MNELAGGFYRGDKVLCNGRPGMIFGKPARAQCAPISVSVMYDDGTTKDERVANLQLIEDLEGPVDPPPISTAPGGGAGEVLDEAVKSGDPDPKMNELAGGFERGDRVMCHGRPGIVFGKSARAACARIAVSVMYEDGSMSDERIVNLQAMDEPAVQHAPPEPIPARALPSAPAPEPEEAEEEVPEEDLDTSLPQPGDKVLCNGRPGMIVGKPARAGCPPISVSVMYDDGTTKDERVANLQLIEDLEGPVDFGEVFDEDVRAGDPDPKMNELAGGYARGDRVMCHGRPGIVFGKPARAACARIAVSVMYEDGSMNDERIVNVQAMDEPAVQHAPPEEVHESAPSVRYPRYQRSPPEPIPARALAAAPAPEPEEAEEEVPEEDLDTTLPQPGEVRRMVPTIEGIGRKAEPQEQSAAPQEARRSLFDEPPAVEAVEPNEEKVDDMADKILEKIRRNYATLRTAFRALDRSNNGYISRVDFLDALEHIFINSGCTPEEIDAIAGRFGFGEGCADTLSYEEFCEAVGQVEEDPYEETMQNVEVAMEDRSDRQRIEEAHLAIQTFRQISDRRYASLRESFRALDKSRKSALSPAEFAHGLSMHGVNLKPEEMQDAWNLFDPKGTGQITYADYCRVMSQRVQFGKHLSRQMYK